MPTAFTHAFVAAAIGSLAPRGRLRVRLVLLGMLLALLPDLDVALFRLGVPYEHPLGHRGFSHSLLFAVLAGVGAAALWLRDLSIGSRVWWGAALMLCACSASHGVLDAFTDAGLGVGFLLPFDATRYFAPWRPLATSPLSVVSFFSGPAVPILANELLWVWLPVGLAAVVARAALRARSGPA